jgi:hypothetical protein
VGIQAVLHAPVLTVPDITLFVITAIVGPFGYVNVVIKLVVLGPLTTVLVAPAEYVIVGPFGIAVVRRFAPVATGVGNVTLEPTIEANFSGDAACAYRRLANQDSQRIAL